MDYNTFLDSLSARGLKNHTSLGKNEANFADYGHALSDELKAQISQNATTQEGKELQAFVASLFGGKSNLQTNDLLNKCRANGLQVNSTYKKTSYIMDEKNGASPGKGTKKVRTGSINIIEIVDPKTGAKMTIADANGNAAIEIEEVFLNEILTGVSSDIAASGGGGIDGASLGPTPEEIAAKRAKELEAEKVEKEAQLAEIKKQNAELAKQIESLQEETEADIQAAQDEINRINEQAEREIESIIAKWTRIYEANPDSFSKEFIDSQMMAEVGICRMSAQTKVDVQEGKFNAALSLMTQINSLISQTSKLEDQMSNVNSSIAGINSELVQTGSSTTSSLPQLDVNAYAMQQGATNSSAAKYNDMLMALKQQNVSAQQEATISQMEIAANATSGVMVAKSQTAEIDTVNEIKHETEARAEEQRQKLEQQQKDLLEQEEQRVAQEIKNERLEAEIKEKETEIQDLEKQVKKAQNQNTEEDLNLQINKLQEEIDTLEQKKAA